MDSWEFFQSSEGLWQWRCTSADGSVLLNSAEAHPLLVQAVAEAITHGFVERAREIDAEVTRETHQVAGTGLEALMLKYESAYLAYKSCVAALSDATSTLASNRLREDVARALDVLERARKEYGEALVATVFGAASSES